MKMRNSATSAFLVGVILSTSTAAMACEVTRALSETQFTIDPSTHKSRLESKINNAQLQIERCALDEKYILVNFNSIYFQNDTSRLESISGNLVQKNSNCSIATEVPFQKVDDSELVKSVADRNNFLKKCIQIIIADQRGMKIQTHPQSKCEIKSLNSDGSIVQTDGSGCLIAISPSAKISMEQSINPDCLNSSFLNQNQIQAGDYESVLKLWPVAVEADQLKVMSPIGLRYLRHTMLPNVGFMPRAVKDTADDMSYIGALSTNISPGNVAVRSIGQNKYQIQPTFLVENLAKDFCSNGQCAKISSYVTPIAGSLKLYKLDKKSGRQSQVGQWNHALKIPANWSGLAQFTSENNLSGQTMGALEIDMKITAGDEFTLSADFFEPRTLIDETVDTESYITVNNSLIVGEGTGSSLPSLPSPGQIGQVKKLPSLPSVALGMGGLMELSDLFNMKKNWTQHYDRVCNSVNMNCAKLSGINKSFISVKMKFKMNEYNEVIPMNVEKQSAVFDSYKKDVQTFAKMNCI